MVRLLYRADGRSSGSDPLQPRQVKRINATGDRAEKDQQPSNLEPNFGNIDE